MFKESKQEIRSPKNVFNLKVLYFYTSQCKNQPQKWIVGALQINPWSRITSMQGVRLCNYYRTSNHWIWMHSKRLFDICKLKADRRMKLQQKKIKSSLYHQK